MVRTAFPLAAVLAIGLSAAFFAGSGFNAIVDGDSNLEQVTGSVEDEANKSAAGNGSVSASRGPSDEGSIAGVILSGANSLLSTIQLIVLLPTALQQLGFPFWFAKPIGHVVQIIAGIGFIQFITGRVLE